MRVFEIFESINGEIASKHQGSLCTFIRLSGCNLKCSYCDTKKSQDPSAGKEMAMEEVIQSVIDLGNTNVTITGGEPLTQKEELLLLAQILFLRQFDISIETNGSIEIPNSWFVESWVADWKLPSSGMTDQMDLLNFASLSRKDIIKFVIQDRRDFEAAMEIVKIVEKKPSPPLFAFSPCFGQAEPLEIIKWMQKENILKRRGSIFNYQIHKIINVA